MAKVSVKKPGAAKRDTSKALQFAEKGKSKSGLVPSGDVRLTANIKSELHTRLKIEAAKRRTTIGDLVEELIDQHVPKI